MDEFFILKKTFQRLTRLINMKKKNIFIISFFILKQNLRDNTNLSKKIHFLYLIKNIFLKKTQINFLQIKNSKIIIDYSQIKVLYNLDFIFKLKIRNFFNKIKNKKSNSNIGLNNLMNFFEIKNFKDVFLGFKKIKEEKKIKINPEQILKKNLKRLAKQINDKLFINKKNCFYILKVFTQVKINNDAELINFFDKIHKIKKKYFLKNLLNVSSYFWKVSDFTISTDKILERNIVLINSKYFFKILKKINSDKKILERKNKIVSLKNQKKIYSKQKPKKKLEVLIDDYRSNGSYNSEYENNHYTERNNKNNNYFNVPKKLNQRISHTNKVRNIKTGYKKKNKKNTHRDLKNLKYQNNEDAFDYLISKEDFFPRGSSNYKPKRNKGQISNRNLLNFNNKNNKKDFSQKNISNFGFEDDNEEFSERDLSNFKYNNYKEIISNRNLPNFTNKYERDDLSEKKKKSKKQRKNKYSHHRDLSNLKSVKKKEKISNKNSKKKKLEFFEFIDRNSTNNNNETSYTSNDYNKKHIRVSNGKQFGSKIRNQPRNQPPSSLRNHVGPFTLNVGSLDVSKDAMKMKVLQNLTQKGLFPSLDELNNYFK